MQRRAHIEWMGHMSIKVTNFAMQKTYDLPKLKLQGNRIDLVSGKMVSRNETVPIFFLEIFCGNGKLGSPFYLRAMAEVEKNKHSDLCQPFSIYEGKEQTIEVDFP